MPPHRGGEGPPFIVGARDAHPGNGADGRAEGPPSVGTSGQRFSAGVTGSGPTTECVACELRMTCAL